MIPAINNPVAHLYQSPLQPNEPVLTRNKRALDQTGAEQIGVDSPNLSANDRPKSSGTLDSLGRGNLP